MPGPYLSPVPVLGRISHYSRLEKTTIPLATQDRLHIARSTYHYAYARQTQFKSKQETNKVKLNKGKERKTWKPKTKTERIETRRQEKQEKTRQEEKERKGKNMNMSYYQTLGTAKDGIGFIEGIKCIINCTGWRSQHGEELKAVLRRLMTAIGRPTIFKTMIARPSLSSSGGGMNCVSYDNISVYVPRLVCLCFSPWVSLSSRATGSCLVITGLFTQDDVGTSTSWTISGPFPHLSPITKVLGLDLILPVGSRRRCKLNRYICSQ